jgi:hypothetical protein
LSNQIVKPSSLDADERDGMIAGMSWQNQSRLSSDIFTDRLPT